MIHAYSQHYVQYSKNKFAIIMDYLATYCSFSDEEITDILLNSHVVEQFLNGNPMYIMGKSGSELAMLIAKDYIDTNKIPKYQLSLITSPYHWLGNYLCYYCWYTCRSLKRIFYALSLRELIKMYDVFHQMPIDKFINVLDERIIGGTKETNLKIIRTLRNLSQSELAKKSSVSIRSIQLYEQRVNDIDKAQVQTLFKLAKSLNCNIEDLLENPYHDF